MSGDVAATDAGRSAVGDIPAACTLEASGALLRLQRWRDLDEVFLLTRQRRPGKLLAHYSPAPAVREELTALVDGERTCCSFLAWDLAEDATGLHLSVRGRDEDLDALAGATG